MSRFFIKPAMDTGYTVNIWGGYLAAGAQIILWQEQTSEWNSVWQLTADGVIASAADPSLVLASGSPRGTNDEGYLVQLAQRTGDAGQKWNIKRIEGLGSVAVFSIQNQQTGQYLNTNCNAQNFGEGQQLVTWSETTPQPNEYWVLEDLDEKSNALYIQCGSSGGLYTETPYVLDLATLDNTGTTNTYNLVVNQWEQGKLSQAWQLNPDGTITNVRTPLLAVTATGHQSDVQVQPLVLNQPPTAMQQWNYSESENLFTVNITSSDTEYLNVAGGAHEPKQGNQVITWTSSSGSNNNWYMFDYAPTASAQAVSIQITSNNQTYALGVANGGLELQTCQSGFYPQQLWMMYPNGIIASCHDQSQVLTCDLQGNQAVTLQSYSSGSPVPQQQQWWLQANGVLAIKTNAGMQYLECPSGVADGSAVATGSSQSNWSIVPYEPASHPGLWFTIRSATALPGSGAQALLTMSASGKLTVSAPAGVSFGLQSSAALNQLWRLTINGALVNALDPSLVLTVSGNDISLAASSGGSLEQQWQWAYSTSLDITERGQQRPVLCGVLQNMGTNNFVLAAPAGSGDGNGVSVQAELGTGRKDSPGKYPQQLWYVVPQLPAYDQATSLTVYQGGTATPLVLALAEYSFAPGTLVDVVPSSSAPVAMTWQFTDSGQIVNVLNPQAVLSLKAGDAKSLAIYPLQPDNQPFQTWMVSDDGLIYNLETEQVLTVTESRDGTVSLGMQAPVPNGMQIGDKSSVYQRWDMTPSSAFMTVLMQPPVPYPVAPARSEEAGVYVYINAMLGLQPEVAGVVADNGLRLQYANLAAPLSSYQRQLNALVCPPNTGKDVWDRVVNQLDTELTAAIGVQAFFTQLTTLHLMYSQAQAMALPGLVTAVQLSETDKVVIKKHDAWIWDLCQGVLYTALNFGGAMLGDPEAAKLLEDYPKARNRGMYGMPFLANCMQTSLSVTQSVMQSKRGDIQRDINFEMDVVQLQQHLLESFEIVGTTLGSIQAAVFKDWGRLRGVFEMTRLTRGGSSLFWPSTAGPTLVSQLLPGYISSVLQLLMPASSACQTIYRTNEDARFASPGLQQDLVTFADFNPDGTQTTYTLGNSDPTQQMTQLMQVVWGNGVNPFQFFHGEGPWSQLTVKQASNGWNSGPFMVAYLRNFTGDALSVDAYMDNPDNPAGQVCGPTNPVSLPPYGLANFAAASNGVAEDPVHGTVIVQNASNETIATGYFNAAGTSHNWSCTITGSANYSIKSSYHGVIDDMIVWKIGIFSV